MIGWRLRPTWDPVWPWNVPYVGLAALLLVALLIVGLTLATYWTSPRRGGWTALAAMIFLRLSALGIAVVVLLRPAIGYEEGLPAPGTVLIVVDASQSMTIQDEANNQSRWQAQLAALEQSEPALRRLQLGQNVVIVRYQFAEDIADFDPKAEPVGKRTDIGQALASLYDRHQKERNLRGLLLLSDGADNGVVHQPLAVAGKWRALGCPIHTFRLGQESTTPKHRDIAVDSLTAEPSVVPVKSPIILRALVHAPGYDNQDVKVRILFDDQEVLVRDEVLRKREGNELKIAVDAPAKEGEIKVTLRIDPKPDEAIIANNQAETIVSVIKEGLRVLYVEGKDRAWEPTFIRRALRSDPRFSLYYSLRLGDEAIPANQADWFQFDKQHYDVVIIGDISASRFCGGRPEVLAQLVKLIRQGTGLLMIGGYETFGDSDWHTLKIEGGGTFADVLPVETNVNGQSDDEVAFQPTAEGLDHYLLRLAATDEETKKLWKELPPLNGMNLVGKPKVGAIVYAQTEKKAPQLVGHAFGEGRTLALTADSTWLWRNYDLPKSEKGAELHARFWRQLVLWLAKQETQQGTVWIRPDARRLPAGSKLGFAFGLRGKNGLEVPGARFEIRVTDPQKAETTLAGTREENQNRALFDKTSLAGEYRITVKASGKDTDGKDVHGEQTARFLVYADDTEMTRYAADAEFLARLANAGGGKAHQAGELPAFLEHLQSQVQVVDQPKKTTWPDWQREPPSWSVRDQVPGMFLSGALPFFLLFVIVLTLEWIVRRSVGMV